MLDALDTAPSQKAADDGRLKVFISYSRENLDFADQLEAGLELCGFDATLDRHEITAGEAWQQRLGNLIRDADSVAFVLSPASASSKICAWEVEEATRLSKRILPVVCGPLGDTSPPQLLQNLNYIFFYPEQSTPGAGFGVGLAALVAALSTDVEWIREHTRLLQRATEWEKGGRPPNRLLSGQDILDAKAWAARRPKGAPEPTTLHLDFIRASEEEEASRANAERRRLDEMAAAQGERAKALSAAEDALKQAARAQAARARARNLAAAALSIIAAIAIYYWWNAEAEREAAVRAREAAIQSQIQAEDARFQAQVLQSRMSASLAQAAAAEGDQTKRLLLTLDALERTDERGRKETQARAVTTMRDGLAKLREIDVFDGEGQLSPDGKTVLHHRSDEPPFLTTVGKPDSARPLGREPWKRLRSAIFSPDSTRVLTVGDDQPIVLWDVASAKPLMVLTKGTVPTSNLEISADGRYVMLSEQIYVEVPGEGQSGTTKRDFGFRPRIWVIADGQEMTQALFPGTTPATARFTSDGTAVIMAEVVGDPAKIVEQSSRDFRIVARAIEIADRRERWRIGGVDGELLTDVTFSDDGRSVVGTRGDGSALFWKPPGIEPFPLAGHTSAVNVTRFSGDGRRLLSVSQDALILRDTETGRELARLKQDSDNAQFGNATFSPDGTAVVTTFSNIPPILWDAETGKRRAVLGTEPRSAAYFSPPDGRLILVQMTTGMAAWEVQPTTATRNATAQSAEEEAGAVRQPDFMLGTGTRSGKPSFRADGQFMLTQSGEGIARLWSLAPIAHAAARDGERSRQVEVLIEEVKNMVPRCLSIMELVENGLDAEPPDWCLSRRKFPYREAKWASWPPKDATMARRLGFASGTALVGGEDQRALTLARLAQQFDDGTQFWIGINLAHALMYTNDIDAARTEYLRHKGETVKVESRSGPWEQFVLADFEDYRARRPDTPPPLMDEIEALFKASLPQEPPPPAPQ